MCFGRRKVNNHSLTEVSDIVFIGPTGSGKSSLIGTLYRAVCEVLHFPDRVELVLNHPDADSHGTMHWLETLANRRGTVVYQDTRGDQVHTHTHTHTNTHTHTHTHTYAHTHTYTHTHTHTHITYDCIYSLL